MPIVIGQCLALTWLSLFLVVSAQAAPKQMLRGHVPPAVARHHLQPLGRVAPTNELHLAISLPLRNPQALDDLLRQVSTTARMICACDIGISGGVQFQY